MVGTGQAKTSQHLRISLVAKSITETQEEESADSLDRPFQGSRNDKNVRCQRQLARACRQPEPKQKETAIFPRETWVCGCARGPGASRGKRAGKRVTEPFTKAPSSKGSQSSFLRARNWGGISENATQSLPFHNKEGVGTRYLEIEP